MFLTIVVMGGAALLSCKFGPFSRLQRGLDDAVMHGNVDAARDMIVHGAKVNVQDPRTGWTVLMEASSKGDAAVAEALLNGGADPNLHSKTGTALHLAAYNRHTAIVRALIAHGADINAKEGGWTVLMAAAGGGSSSVVKLLLAHGADVDAVDIEKGHHYTALRLARSHEKLFREHPPRSRLYANESDYAAVVQLLKQAGAKE